VPKQIEKRINIAKRKFINGGLKMFIKRSILFFLLTLCFAAIQGVQICAAASAVPNASSNLISVIKFTGTIRIITPDNKVITVFRGSKMPDIRFGSKIQVLSGKTEILAGDTILTLSRSQAVMISRNDFTRGVEITTADDNVGLITCKVQGTEFALDKGEKVDIIKNAEGQSEIRAMEGTITLITPEGEKELHQGTSVTAEQETDTNKSSMGSVASIVVPEPPQIPVEEASPSIP
jgi:hypothetical protein